MKKLLFVFWLIPSFLHAATYCVSTTGSEANGGTNCTTDAWLTPGGKASTVPVAGDTVQFKGGTYPASSILPAHSGSAGSHIVYRNVVGETPVIQPNNSTSTAFAFSSAKSCDYIDVIGLTLTGGSGAGGAGVQIKNHHDILIDSCEIYGNETGFYVWSDNVATSHDVTIQNCNVHDNSASNALVAQYTDHVTLQNNTFANTTTSHNVLVNSSVNVNGGAGVVTRQTLLAGGSGYSASFALSYSGGTCSGVTGTATATAGVVTSIALTSGGSGCGTTPPTISFAAGGGSGASAEAEIAWGPDGRTRTAEPQYITIKNNIVSGSAREGIELLTPFYILVQGNTVFSNGFSGIQVEQGARYIIVDGNTTYGNSVGCVSAGEEGIWSDGSSYVIISNNKSYNNEGGSEISGSNYHIYRWNQVYLNKSCSGAAHFALSIGIAGHNGGWKGASHVAVVQNSFYDSGAVANTNGPLAIGFGNLTYAPYFNPSTFQNNIVSETLTTRDRCDPGNGWTLNDYNVYYNSRATWSARTGNLTCGSGTSQTFASYKGVTSYDSHTVVQDPQFNSPTTGDFTIPSSSPAYRNGNWLTTAVGSGSGSTSLTVANSDFFSDGFGLITGDTIQFQGSTTLYTVTAINRGTNVLTISPAATWSDGQGVGYPYKGAQPDIGALTKSTSGLVKVTGR